MLYEEDSGEVVCRAAVVSAAAAVTATILASNPDRLPSLAATGLTDQVLCRKVYSLILIFASKLLSKYVVG